jgi:hypothetical protein
LLLPKESEKRRFMAESINVLLQAGTSLDSVPDNP